mmetsp:Transcript_163292/g.396872  ORF Transcript_163292/g.396872 Transcript_163292/m.396872 type:complete len:252 (-) Transcript_163292:1424-2179(-)
MSLYIQRSSGKKLSPRGTPSKKCSTALAGAGRSGSGWARPSHGPWPPPCGAPSCGCCSAGGPPSGARRAFGASGASGAWGPCGGSSCGGPPCCWCAMRPAYAPPCREMSSAWVPRSTMQPWRMTTIWSALRTVVSRWAMTRVVRPVMSRSRASWIRRSVSLSRALVASSKITRLGLLSIARAIATLCFWPPESDWPPLPTSVSKPSGKCTVNAATCADLAASSICASLANGLPYMMFSRMVPRKSFGSCST